jgi:hypothetical protein
MIYWMSYFELHVLPWSWHADLVFFGMHTATESIPWINAYTDSQKP